MIRPSASTTTRCAMRWMSALWVISAVAVPSSRLTSSSASSTCDAGLAVERAGGFVAEQHLGPLGDGAGDGDALLLAARKLGREMVHPVRQADALQRLFGGIGFCAISVTRATFSRAVRLGTRL
jgi:hypothetical protein